MKTFFKVLLFGGLFAGFIYTLYYLWNKEQVTPVVYETEQAVTTNIIKKSMATGSVIPRKEVEIKSQVSGIIQELFAEAGTQVKKGDLLARVKIIPDMVSLNNAENRLNRARIGLQQAEREHRRNKSLFDEQVISVSEYNTSETALENAREEWNAAANHLELIRKGVTKNSDSSNTLIRSTIAGMVLDVPVKEGSSVIESNTFNDGTTIAFVADMNNMIFEGNVDESEVNKIRPGMPLILNIGAIEDRSFHADLEYISPKGETIDGAVQFEIRAALRFDPSATSDFIRAGYSASADIVLDRRDSVLSLRENLLQFIKGQAYVEVEVGDQKFEKRHVTLGLSDGIFVEVLDGIDPEIKIKQPNTHLRRSARQP